VLVPGVNVPLFIQLPPKDILFEVTVRAFPATVAMLFATTMLPVKLMFKATVPAPVPPIDKLPLTVNVPVPEVLMPDNIPEELSNTRLPKVRPLRLTGGVKALLPLKIKVLLGSSSIRFKGVEIPAVVL